MDIDEFLKMQAAPKALTELALPLVSQLNSFCVEQGLVGLVQADHISLKCSSSVVYEARRKDMEDKSTFIFQSIISNRRISVIGLKDSIPTKVGEIKYLELSDQKPDNSQVDRIDHIEIAPTGISYEELVAKVKASGANVRETVRPHHTTYDVILPTGFEVRLAKEMLIEKIKREEML
jgi:predicted metalloenzyme YecM